MYRCCANTNHGTLCKNKVSQEGHNCSWHTVINDTNPTCSICMDNMNIRNYRELPCKHKFHKKCLNKWKLEGNRTCPLCREPFDIPMFKVTVHVEPTSTETHERREFDMSRFALEFIETMGMDMDDMQHFNTNMSFEAEDMDNLQAVLSGIGLELSQTDLDTLIRRDAE